MTEQDKLPLVTELPEENEVPQTQCLKCAEVRPDDHFTVEIKPESRSLSLRNRHNYEITALFRCSSEHPPHEWPVRLRNNTIVETAEALDPIGTGGLNTDIAEGLRQDLQEAARCYHYGLNKGAVVISRRAVQLALEDKIPGLNLNKRWTLGSLIPEARKITPPLMTPTGFSHCETVLAFGNDGAHSAVAIAAENARTVVWAAVQILTELASPATQSGTGSNVP